MTRALRRRAAAAVVAAALVPVVAAPAAEARDCAPLEIRAQAAQLVMTGVPGTSVTPEAEEVVAEHAGSVILMGRNVEDADQVAALVEGLREAAPHDLLVAVDEEGGRVARLGSAGAVRELPAARELAAERSPAEVRSAAAELGEGLAELGVDLNLAPVLDVTGADGGTVIGDRAYAAEAERAAQYGLAFAQGMADAGVGAVGKHFPGHGRTTVDSHETLPRVDASLERLEASDFVPFREALRHLDAVMTAHVVVEALDDELPASLSPLAHELLRDLGHDGLVITDALEMGAIVEGRDVAQAAEEAIAAGADLALVANPWQEAGRIVDRLADARHEGRIARERWDAAVRRVLEAKGLADEEVSCLLGMAPVERAGPVRVDDGAAVAGAGRLRDVPEAWVARPWLPAYGDDELERLAPAAPVACLAGGCGRPVRWPGR